MFLIWWTTGRQMRGTAGTSPQQTQSTGQAGAGVQGDSDDSTAVPRGGVLRGPTDPDATAETMAMLTQATLVRVSRSTDELEPWLAESWTSADNVTYLLKLRPNILWSDGTALTATEVVSSLASARVLGKPLTMRAVSPMEVQITFPGSFAPG